MNHTPSMLRALLLCSLLLAACSPAVATPSDSGTGQQPSRGPTSLVIALDGEPKILGTQMSLGNESNRWGDIAWALHQRLSRHDDRGELQPRLAIDVPSQANGTWILRPDGSMQTRYELRKDVTWHDGTPLSARDFTFAYTMTKDPDLPISNRRVVSQIERLDTPDDHTLIIEWSQIYLFANAITEDDLGPLPAHLLQQAYLGDKERFQTLPYWRTDFIGVGPYRLLLWEPGSHLVLKAYERYALGRAKIDTITVRFIDDGNTAVANLLAGAVEGTLPGTIDFNQTMLVKDEWERGGKRPVLISQVTHWRTLAVQFRANLANPREILDARTRRGLLHAVDRQAIVDLLFQGQAPASHGYLPPSDPRFEWIKDATVVYDHDPRRALEVLAGVGWRRASDGRLVNSAGERVHIPIWTSPGSEQPVAVTADNWRQLGASVEEHVLPPGEARDTRVVCCFPAVQFTSFPNSFQFNFERSYGGACPAEANRFVGWNRGCYQNAEMDKLVEAVRIAIDPSDQRRLYRDIARIFTAELPHLPLFFPIQTALFREGVVGVKPNTDIRTPTWNINEWELR